MQVPSNALGIWYVPLPGEINPESLELVRSHGLRPWRTVPADQTRDPFLFAVEILRAYAEEGRNRPVYLLIPGTRFDALSTRHGRGGGWYDRFLSRIPREWRRIGVCGPGQWSEETLSRKSWDEPMDEVIRVS